MLQLSYDFESLLKVGGVGERQWEAYFTHWLKQQLEPMFGATVLYLRDEHRRRDPEPIQVVQGLDCLDTQGMHFNLLKACKVPREILGYPDFVLRTSYEPEICDEAPLPGQFFRLDEYSIFEWETGFSQDLDKDTAWSRLSRHAFIIPGTLLGYRDNCLQQADEPCRWLTTTNWLRTVYAGMLQHMLAA